MLGGRLLLPPELPLPALPQRLPAALALLCLGSARPSLLLKSVPLLPDVLWRITVCW